MGFQGRGECFAGITGRYEIFANFELILDTATKSVMNER